MVTFNDLETDAKRLTAILDGTWNGVGGIARCPAHEDATPSLSIAAGRTTILLHCFAGCDFIDILRAIRLRNGLRGGVLPMVRSPKTVTLQDYAPLARKIWAEAHNLAGTLGEQYMRRRGLAPPWHDLRFHPRTPVGRHGFLSFRPALIAAIRDNSGLVAVHRIVLDPKTGGKALDLENPKLTLGRPKHGAVRLLKTGRSLGIAEGIETAKSAAARLSIPVWAVLGSERFPQIDIPFDISHLFLLPDRGPAGQRAATRALKAFTAPGRTIEVLFPPEGFGDWNDFDQAEGADSSYL